MRGRPPKLHLSKSLGIWVDADSCPPAAREALFEIAHRRRIPLTLVGMRAAAIPGSAFIRSVTIVEGADPTTARLQQLAAEGDLVVSGDAQLLRSLAARKVIPLQPAPVAALTQRLEELLNLHEREALARVALARSPKSAAPKAEEG